MFRGTLHPINSRGTRAQKDTYSLGASDNPG